MAAPFGAGDPVLVEWIDARGLVRSFRSRILNVTAEALHLEAPPDAGAAKEIRPGPELSLRREGERGGADYAAVVKVVERLEGETPTLVTTLPHGVDQVPRRRFQRVDTNLPIQVRGALGRVRNISSGGLLAALPPGTVSLGQPVECEVDLPGRFGRVRLRGRVVRVAEDGPWQVAGVDLTQMSEAVRDEILRYVVETAAG